MKAKDTPSSLLWFALVVFASACHSTSGPSAPKDDCAGPGRYEAGKSQPAVACCQGLHRVELLSGVYEGNDKHKVCARVPASVYACVSGACGDGTCEAGEAEPCGCPSDCPSAVWEETP
jgi:hypothetical protein